MIILHHQQISSVTRIHGKQPWSTRSKILTIIIVLFIILTVAIVVGVVVGITKSKQSISEMATTTTINNQTSLSATTLVSSTSIGSQSGSPCSSYTTINDPSRNVAQTSLYGFCDNGAPFNTSNGGSWIRFIGTGGTTIPLTSPGLNNCGAYIGGWFNGTLPTTVDCQYFEQKKSGESKELTNATISSRESQPYNDLNP
ncbi:unnamed protein product [Rotaria sp. Silwood2]|nr:unnamed protein product [Rotaria sp. Silwood2]